MKAVVYAVRGLPGGVPPEVAERVHLKGGAARPAPRERLVEEALLG